MTIGTTTASDRRAGVVTVGAAPLRPEDVVAVARHDALVEIAPEALAQLPAPPTHVFLQAGVGGFASAVAAHLAVRLGAERPHITVVEPARAACVFESARAGQPVQVPDAAPTVMAMLECYAPSPIAFRVLARLADGFMTVEEEDAVAVMRRLAFPLPGDPAVVAGESGGAGLRGRKWVTRSRVTVVDIA